MDTVLLILGVLGLGAIIVSAYVFTVAARNFVSETGPESMESGALTSSEPGLIHRSPTDRRQLKAGPFPLTLDGLVIQEDRRKIPDRRMAPA